VASSRPFVEHSHGLSARLHRRRLRSSASLQDIKMVMNRRKVNPATIFSTLALLLLIASQSAFAQQSTTNPPAPSGNTPTQTAPPSSTSGITVAPSGNQPQGQAAEPGSNARPVTPAGQTEQSVQPTTQADQQTRGTQAAPVTQPQTPQGGVTSIPTTDSLTNDSLPSGNAPSQAPAQQSQQQVPVGTVQPAQAPAAPGRESVPAPAPSVTETLPNVPVIAPNYRAPERPLPEIGRVGVDMAEQRPLSLREALEMALANNKDIEVARDVVREAEFDLMSARGAYDPRLSSFSYYERTVTPSASFLSGGSNGAVTQSDYTGTARVEGLMPKFGGGYRVDLSAIRLTTDNQFAALNPQFP